MGKGVAKRHRQKNFDKAREGNLLKQSLGKGKAIPLVEGKIVNPDNVTASLRKLMKLQEASKKDEARRAARQQQLETKASQPHQSSLPAGTAKQFTKTQPQPTPDISHTAALQAAMAQSQQTQQPNKKGPKHQSSASALVEERIYKANAFEQSKKKKLKDSKREYLERRKLMKKAGRKTRDLVATGVAPSSAQGGKVGKSVLTPVELKLKAQQVASQAKFGEMADAPLKVQLKRKHWVSKGTDAKEGDGGESGTRLKKIFESQMAQAQQRLEGNKQKMQHKRPGAKSGKGGSAAEAQLLLQRARAVKATQEAREQQECVRQDVVRAYQEHKRAKGKGGEGGATMSSLRALVQRSASAAAAAEIR